MSIWKKESSVMTIEFYDAAEVAGDILKDVNAWLDILHQQECEHFPDEQWDRLVRGLKHLRRVAVQAKNDLEKKSATIGMCERHR